MEDYCTRSTVSTERIYLTPQPLIRISNPPGRNAAQLGQLCRPTKSGCSQLKFASGFLGQAKKGSLQKLLYPELFQSPKWEIS